MNEEALRAGSDAARAIIISEVKPTKIAEQAALDDLMLGFRAVLKDIGTRSPYQAVAKVLARHALAGCPLVSRIEKERRTLVSGRVSLAFVAAHLKTLPETAAQAPQVST